jgi:2-C-methyl-D-erythritol 4-phosphate cytidylyltransferase
LTVARVWSIVVAGGSGRRFGEQKQFSSLGGRPVVEWSVEACRSQSVGVVLVVPVKALEVPRHNAHGADVVVVGGVTRAESVRRGLEAVPAEAEVIVVHDAARPLAPPALFSTVLEALHEEGVVGAVPGLVPSDTIKVVDHRMNVTSTLDRTSLIAVQTPQAFQAAALRHAHARAESAPDEALATDDAMLVEITTRDDLATAERLLAAAQAQEA